jgi:hypothetical protein
MIRDMCRYIVAEIIWNEMKYTDIKEPELDEKKMNFGMYKDQLKKGSEISEPFNQFNFN